MSNLSNLAGIDVIIENNQIILNEEMKNSCLIRIRRVSDLFDVWMKEGIKGEKTVYSTYLGLIKKGDKKKFHRYNIEHGIVIIHPGLFGNEYPKLFGHYHENENLRNPPSPEIHCVLSGRGYFLLQKSIPPYNHCSDAILIDARVGDCFIIPPYYGHIAINPSKKALVFNGFYDSRMKANYKPYQTHRGAVYYAIKKNEYDNELIPNQHFLELPQLRRFLARDLPKPKFSKKNSSCYESIKEQPSEFSFLTDPRKYKPGWFY